MAAVLVKATTATVTDACCVPSARGNGAAIDEADAEEYASWFKTLADPTRIRILNLLAQAGQPVCVCDITDHFAVGQPTISHHLKILRDSCFVTVERRGTYMYYRANDCCLSKFPEAARRIMAIT